MKRSEKERATDLKQNLDDMSVALRDTFQLLNCPATSMVEKVPWDKVKEAAEHVVKKSTIAGVLWASRPKIDEARDEMKSYCNALQGFLLLSHGSTVEAGPTLLSSIQLVAKQVLESSLRLLEEAIKEKTKRQGELPTLVGCVWEACDSVKKAPPDNRTALGRKLVEVARSMKDVVREMDELKPASINDEERLMELSSNVSEVGACEEPSEENHEVLESLDEFPVFDSELSDQEMQVAIATKEIVKSALELVKQLLYVVGDASAISGDRVNESAIDVLERIVKQAVDIGTEIDDIGASIYPPQEISRISQRLEIFSSLIDSLNADVSRFLGSLPERFLLAHTSFCAALNALKNILILRTSDVY